MKDLNIKIIRKVFIIFIFSQFLINISFSQNIQDFSNVNLNGGLGVSINLNLNWQVLNSYTPPFYEGKALPGEGSDIKVVADVSVDTPAGSFNPSNFFYYWKINDYYTHTYSKTGGNFILFPLDILKSSNTVELKLYSSNKQDILLADKTITIYPSKSKIIFYKDLKNPILTFANALNKKYETYRVSLADDFNIIAEPFYFSTNSPSSSFLSYTWSLNDIPGNMNSTNILNFEPQGAGGFIKKIALKINNKNSPLQSSSETLNLSLDN